MLKNFFISTIKSLGYNVVKINNEWDTVMKDEFFDIYQKCKPYSMTSPERMYALYKAVEYIVKSKIPGDFVECGVWKGGSAMVMLYALMKMNQTNRKIYLYDTFEKMSEPNDYDYKLAKQANGNAEAKNIADTWVCPALEEVKKIIFSTGYPKENIVFVKGRVEGTLLKTIPQKISVLRLDTDWYESTKCELNNLFPLLSLGGVLIVDDYGCWAGSKKAIDEYFLNKDILLNRVDYTGRIGVKI